MSFIQIETLLGQITFVRLWCNQVKFQSSERPSPASRRPHICVSFQFFSPVFYTWNLFSLRKWNLCVFVWKARCAQACSGRSRDCQGPGGGAWQSLVCSPASVISGHSALSEGLRKGARRVGEGACHWRKPNPRITAWHWWPKGRGEDEKLLLCFLEMANLWNCTG